MGIVLMGAQDSRRTAYFQRAADELGAAITVREWDLAYCNRKEEELAVFGEYPAFRIPGYPMGASRNQADSVSRRK